MTGAWVGTAAPVIVLAALVSVGDFLLMSAKTRVERQHGEKRQVLLPLRGHTSRVPLSF
jgi:hypothetical protein